MEERTVEKMADEMPKEIRNAYMDLPFIPATLAPDDLDGQFRNRKTKGKTRKTKREARPTTGANQGRAGGRTKMQSDKGQPGLSRMSGPPAQQPPQPAFEHWEPPTGPAS
jgi:hypothetical protein